MKKLNIDDMEMLNRNCGDCGVELVDGNRSGWFGFFGDGTIQIELCVMCNGDRNENATPIPKDEVNADK